MKKKGILGLILMLLLVCLGTVFMPSTAQAASKKNGWAKKKTVYYYKGKMVKNRWVKITKKKVTVYKKFNKKWLNTKTGNYYYFNKKGKVTKGLKVVGKKIYQFSSSSGKLDKTTTNKLLAAAKYKKDFTELRSLLGAPKRTTYSESCFDDGSGDGGRDGILEYKNFTVYTFLRNSDGKELFMYVVKN